MASVAMKYGFFCFFLFSLTFFACEEEKVSPQHAKPAQDYETQPDQVSWNIKVVFVDSSFTRAKLTALKGRIYYKRMETLLDGDVRVEYMSRYSGNMRSRLSSDSARIDDRTKDMMAIGNVVVYDDSTKTRLKTSKLFWNNAEQKFYSTEYVELDSPSERIQGYGFESDQNLQNYKVFRVSGEKR